MSKEKSKAKNAGRMTPTKKTRNSSGKLGAFIVGILAVCIVVGVALIVFLKSDNKVKAYNVVVTPDNVEQVIEQMDSNRYTPVGSYEVNMNSDWVFPNGSSASTNAYVGNSVSNTNSVYFTVTLDSDKSVVLTSPVIPVGSHLENIKLDKELSKGSYKGVIKYYLLDSAGNEVSNVSVTVNLTIQN